MQNPILNATSIAPPSLPRRFAAMAYDALLIAALWMVAGLPFVLLFDPHSAGTGVRALFQGYLLLIGWLFYAWFWVHGGQTLGMRTWRLRLTRADGGPVGWRMALVRYAAALLALAPLGLGYWWALFDKDKCAWHDRLSGTRLIVTPKPSQVAKFAVSETNAENAERPNRLKTP